MLVALFNQKRYAEMETLSRKMTGTFPNHGIGWKAMGTALLQQGYTLEALAPLQKAAELSHGDAQPYNNLGNALVKLGRLSEAEASYRQSLKLTPGFVEAHHNLGNTLQKLGRHSESEASHRRALALKPGFAEAHNSLGNALQEQGRLSEAEACYQRALALKPDFAEAYNSLGNAFQEQGCLSEAEASYRRALELKPDSVGVRNLVDVLQLQGRFSEALEVTRDILRGIATPVSTAPEIATPITALLPIGRSGSMFFHSLFDGHPELATLPGLYFKGWFEHDAWKRFAPNPAEPKWREHLVGKIVNEYQPLFDARSRKNVVGKPLGNSDWLAKLSGFMEMGVDRSQPFVIDQNAFASVFLSLLATLPSVGQKVCFELIHRAFEISIRGNTAAGSREGGQIFYHLHNPEILELAHFLHHYPQARLLYIVRNPVQSMESWMLIGSEVNADTNGKLEAEYRWHKAAGVVKTMFNQLRSPFNTLAHSRGVRLEDVKRDAKRVMPQIAAWMDIPDHPSLYETSFCGLQYWGPASKTTGKITGFDTKAIDRPVGQLLGPRDTLIFETLFWPFSHQYGYTDLDAMGFRRQLTEIRPWLDEPLEFETKFYAELPDHTRALKDLPPYNRLHRLLHQTWAMLDRDGTYHGMVQPLELK